jgi:hypothetical protein
MERRKITVEIDLEEIEKMPMGMWTVNQSFHEIATGEKVGLFKTDLLSGDSIIQVIGKDVCWRINKEQNAKIFTAILLQSDQSPIAVDQTDLD